MAEFSNGYILGFAAGLCVVCSLALAGTHAALKPIQDVNRVRDYQKDVLSALGLPEDGHTPAGEEIDRLGTTLMRLEEKVKEIQKHFQIEDLNINLGPLGKLLDEEKS